MILLSGREVSCGIISSQDIPVVVAICQANMRLASCAQQGCSMSPEFAVRFVKFEGNATPQVRLTLHNAICVMSV